MHTHRAEMDRQNGEMNTSTAKATAEKTLKTAGKEKGTTDKQRRCTRTAQMQTLYGQGGTIDERRTQTSIIAENARARIANADGKNSTTKRSGKIVQDKEGRFCGV